MRRVDDDDASARRDGAPNLVPVDAVVRGTKRDEPRRSSAQFDSRNVRVVYRLKEQHLVSRMHQSGEHGEQPLGSAGRDRDFGHGIVPTTVEMLDLRRERLTQWHHTLHRRVLIVTLTHVSRDGVHEIRRAVEIGEPLREVDRPKLVRQPGHRRENAYAPRRQLGAETLELYHWIHDKRAQDRLRPSRLDRPEVRDNESSLSAGQDGSPREAGQRDAVTSEADPLFHVRGSEAQPRWISAPRNRRTRAGRAVYPSGGSTHSPTASETSGYRRRNCHHPVEISRLRNFVSDQTIAQAAKLVPIQVLDELVHQLGPCGRTGSNTVAAQLFQDVLPVAISHGTPFTGTRRI